MSLPERLKEIRILRGYTSPEDAACELDAPFSGRTLRKWEDGVEPSASALKQLCLFYRKPADWFLELGRYER